MRSVGFAVTFCPGLVALIKLSLGSFELFIAGLVSLCCDGIFASCPCCVCILAARRSSRFLSQCGVFLLFFVFGVTSGAVSVGSTVFCIVDNALVVVIFIVAVLCVHVACLLVFFRCVLYEVCCLLSSFSCCRRGSRSDDVIIGGSAGSNRSRSCTFSFARRCPVLMVVMCAVAVSVDVTPTVLSSLLSWLCSSFAGDGANCVSLLLSGVPSGQGRAC